jgi:hypothetical protein
MLCMQTETNEIIERTPGFNNQEMWKQCELLKSVVFQTIQVKSGRGKGVRVIEEFKHNIPSEVRNRIANSCEYYKNLYEEDMKKEEVGSLEVIKYRFEKINGEPKIIIDMVKVLNKNGAYLKFAKLEGVVNYLSKYPVKFKDYDSI